MSVKSRAKALRRFKEVTHNHNTILSVDGSTILIEDGHILRRVKSVYDVPVPNDEQVYKAFLKANEEIRENGEVNEVAQDHIDGYASLLHRLNVERQNRRFKTRASGK